MPWRSGALPGSLASFTPFLGLHIVIAVTLSWLLRGNLIAAALGTFFGNPLTFPFIWTGTYEVGQFLLSGGGADTPDVLMRPSAMISFREIIPLIEPMLIGAIPLGLAAACLTYVIVYRSVLRYRGARLARLVARRQEAEREGMDNLPADI